MFSTSENAHFDASNVRPFFYGHSLIHQPYQHLWNQNPFHHHPFYMHGAGMRSENPYFPHTVVLNEYPGYLVPPSPRPPRVNSRYTSPMFLHMAEFRHHGNFGKKMKNKDTQTDPQWAEDKWKKQDIHLEADSCDGDAGISLYDLAYGRAVPENVVQHNLLSRSSCESKDVFYEDGITCNDEQGAAVLAEQCPVVAGNKQTPKPGSGKKMSLGKEMKCYGAAPRILSPSDEVKPGDKAQLIRGQNPQRSEVCKSAEDVHEEWSDEEWEPLDLCEEAVDDLSPEPIAQHPFSDGERKLDTGIESHGSPQKCLPSPTWLDSFDRFADKAVSCNMSMFEKNLYRVVPPEEYLAWCKKASRKSRKSRSGMARNLGEKKGYGAVPRVLSASDKLKARDQDQPIKSQNSLSSGGSKAAEDVSDEEWKPMYLRSEKCKPAENVSQEGEEEEEEEEEWKPRDLQSEEGWSADDVSEEEEEEVEEEEEEVEDEKEEEVEEEEKEEWKPLDLQSEECKSAEDVHKEWEPLSLCEEAVHDLGPEPIAQHPFSNGERMLDTGIGSHSSPQKCLPSPSWLDSSDRFADKAVSCNMSMFEKNLYRVVPPEEYHAWCKKASRKSRKSRSGMATNLGKKKGFKVVPRALSPSDKLKARDKARSSKSQNSLSSGGCKSTEDVSDEEWKPMYLRSEKCKPAENVSQEGEEEWKPRDLHSEEGWSADDVSEEEEEEVEEEKEEEVEEEEKEEWKPLDLQSEECKSAEDVHKEWEPLSLCEEAVHDLSLQSNAQHPFSNGERMLDTGIGSHSSPQKCLPSPSWLDSSDRFADKAVSCNMSMFEKNLYRVVPPEEYHAWCKKALRKSRKSRSGMATNLGKKKGFKDVPRALSPSDKLKARDKARSSKSQNSLSSGGCKSTEDVSDEEWKPMYLRSEKCKPAENVSQEREEEWKARDLHSEEGWSADDVSEEEEEEVEEEKEEEVEEEEKEEWKPLDLQSEECKSAEDVHKEWEPLSLCEEAVHDLSLQSNAQHPFSNGERMLDTGIGSHSSPQKCLPSPSWLDSSDRFADKAVSCNMSMFEKNLYRVVPPEEYHAWCKKASRKSRKSRSGMATNLGKKKGFKDVPRALSPSDKLKARDKARSSKSQNSLSSGGCKSTEDVSDEEWKPMYLRSEKCKPAENVSQEREEEWKARDLHSEEGWSADDVSEEEEEEVEEEKEEEVEEEEKEEWKPLDLQSEECKSAEDVHKEWEPLSLCEEAVHDLSLQSNAQHPFSNGERMLDTGIGSHSSPQKCLPSPSWLDSSDRFADKAVSCNMSMFEKNLYRVVPPEEYHAWCKKASRKSRKSRSGMATNLGKKKGFKDVPRALSPSDKLKARDKARSSKSQNSLSSGGSKAAEDVSDEEWKPMYLRSEKCKPAENMSKEEWKPLYLRNTIKSGKCCKDEEEIEETNQNSKNCAKIKRKVKGRKLEGPINSSNEKTTYVLKKNGPLNILLSKDSEEWKMEEEAEDDEIYEVECLFQEVSPQDLLSSQGRFYLEVGKRIIRKLPKHSFSPQLIIWPTRNKHQLKCCTYESIPVVYKVKAQEDYGTMSGRLQKKYTTTKQEAGKSKQASHMLLKSNFERPKGKVCG